MVDTCSFQADDDTRQLAPSVTISGGVGELLWIEWLTVLADNQNQFLGTDINACKEDWLGFLG